MGAIFFHLVSGCEVCFVSFCPHLKGHIVYRLERWYIDSHYDTTHVLSYIYWNITCYLFSLKTQLTFIIILRGNPSSSPRS